MRKQVAVPLTRIRCCGAPAWGSVVHALVYTLFLLAVPKANTCIVARGGQGNKDQ